MKYKLLLFLVGLLVVSGTGCKKVPVTSTQPPDVSIVGKWSLTKFDVKEYKNSTFVSDTVYTANGDYLHLYGNRTGYISEPSIAALNLFGDTIKYSFANNMLVIIPSVNYSISFDINSLTANSLILLNRSASTADANSDTTQYTTTSYYTK